VNQPLCHPLLSEAGVEHGFGTRGSESCAPPLIARPQQVHEAAVAVADAEGRVQPEAADAVVCKLPRVAAAIVTADCLPLLACTDDGRCVAAIHAGWRGLAQGVIEAGLRALAAIADHSDASRLRVVVGPHIGPCCYEVDEAVLAPLRARFDDEVARATRPTRPGHAQLDLAQLAQAELARLGVRESNRMVFPDVCTGCDSRRFHSYRRDGERAGRLFHYVVASDADPAHRPEHG
jgi:YfiH family protein